MRRCGAAAGVSTLTPADGTWPAALPAWQDESTNSPMKPRSLTMDALFAVPEPRNETVREYAPGSAQATSLAKRLADLAGARLELTNTIDGVARMAGGEAISVVQPHRHAHVLGVAGNSTHADAQAAVAAAKKAAPAWRSMSYTDRSAIFLRAA